MREPIFIEPIPVNKPWGGSRLSAFSKAALPGHRVGELLVASARSEADCQVREGRLAGLRLSELWADHRHLFGDIEGSDFPLQAKLIDARESLSVQVHPDDDYAAAREQDAGKNECWYVLEPSASGAVLLGHQARTRPELEQKVKSGQWEALFSYRDMQKGDFFMVPAGSVHCLLAGSLVYEVLQSSGVTYRLHDHDRFEQEGYQRELHVENSLEVLSVPDCPTTPHPALASVGDSTDTQLVRGRHFGVRKWEVSGDAEFSFEEPFLFASVIDGRGKVCGRHVGVGDHFLVPSGPGSVRTSGLMTLILCSV